MNYYNPFAAKLTFHKQCFIFAAHWHKNVSHSVLAKAFGVHPETVAKMCRIGNHYYGKVKEQSRIMGIARMYEHYAQPELVDAVEDVIRNREEALAKSRVLEMPMINIAQPDTGEGTYYIRDSHGEHKTVLILSYDAIRKEEPDIQLEAGDGYYVKDPEFGWVVLRDNKAFRTVGDALRYFARFPESLDDFTA